MHISKCSPSVACSLSYIDEGLFGVQVGRFIAKHTASLPMNCLMGTRLLTAMACSGQMCSHRRHYMQALGRCTMPNTPPSSSFLMAPVGQNTAHMRHELHFWASMDTAPMTRVSTSSAVGCPTCCR